MPLGGVVGAWVRGGYMGVREEKARYDLLHVLTLAF